MRDWLDEFFGWLRVIVAVVAGPLFIVLGLTSGHWGYAIFGVLVSIFGGFILKWVIFGK